MSTTLRIPKAAVSMQEGVLTAWLAEDGAAVVEGQPIYALELEKSVMDVEAPAAGILEQRATPGTTYKVGDIIGEIRSPDLVAPVAEPVLAPGSIYHSGYVVADIHAAIDRWSKYAGAGPFAVFDDLQFTAPVYRGRPVSLQITTAFGYSGDTCIELIEAPLETPSVYSEVPGTLHHVGIGVSELDAGIAAYTSAGMACAFRAGFPFGGGCAYLDTLASLGIFTELIEMTPVVSGLLDQIRRAHRDWNRRDRTFCLS